VHLRCRDTVLDLERVAIMGVLNVTPDSFSDGGLWLDARKAIAHGLEMVDQGAAIIDVGGESTRPGADPVSEQEELDRVLPVVEALYAQTDVPISIDTRKPRVALEACSIGASLINDTAGEADKPEMEQVAAEKQVGVVLMHSRGTPAEMKQLTDYSDVVEDVSAFLVKRAKQLEEVGVKGDAIAIDPGIGFAKTVDQNLEILRRLEEVTSLGYPVLIGTSRKSFIGAVLDLPELERLEGTAATVVLSILKGARIVRVHDVEPIARTVKMIETIGLPRVDG
jgi:dihydropteroate synthase